MRQQRKQWADMNRREKAAGLTGLAFIGLVVFGIIWGITRFHTTSTANIEPTDNMMPASSQSADSSSNSTPAPSDTSSTDQPQPAPAPAPQPTTAQQVATWNNKYGYINKSLYNDFTQLQADSNGANISGVSQDCAQLRADVHTAQSFPAIPDAQTASDFSSALSYYDQGAQDCIDGTNNLDTNLIAKGGQEIAEGNTKIEATANDIKALAG